MADGPDFVAALLSWYAANSRDLPWRAPGTSAWAVLVSEIMLQQTPVARVEPAWLTWMTRWPTPADLAASPRGEAVRQWGRLGYPRRAMRLHEAAGIIVSQHGGQVPSDPSELRALPGLGAYAAAAVAAFGYDASVPVLDTNVRRVYSRWRDGSESPTSTSPTVPETKAAADLIPPGPGAGQYSVAVMELGALVCAARTPRCAACPVASTCAWLALGRPGLGVSGRKAQTYVGTDRQVRGLLLEVLRDSPADVVAPASLDRVWADETQRGRALASLLADGLIEGDATTGFHLPR